MTIPRNAGKCTSFTTFVTFLFCAIFSAQVSLSFSTPFARGLRASSVIIVNSLSSMKNGYDDNEGEIGDGYDEFAANFHKILQSEAEASVATATSAVGDTNDDSYCQKLMEASNYYSRDPRDDLSVPLDEAAIRKLLGTRVLARRRKDFREADRVDRDLRSMHGVYAYDKDRIWTTQKTPPRSFMRRKARQAEFARKKQFGSAPYAQVGGEIDPNVCPFTADEIYSLLSRRLQCRMEGKVEIAEAIKFELIVNGVRFSDGLRQWRADGNNQFDKNTKTSPRFAAKYSQHESSPELQTDSVRYRVKRLIQDRAEAIVRRDFHLMDSITLELYRTYNVAVEDKGRTWSVGSDAFGVDVEWEPPSVGKATAPAQPRSSSTTMLLPLMFGGELKGLESTPPYNQSEYSLRLEDETLLPRIEHLIQERLNLKEERTMFGSDAIQKELWVTYNVGLNDRLRQWSVGGIFEAPDSKPGRRRNSGGAPLWAKLLYSHRLSGDSSTNPLSPETVTDIENLIRYFQTALQNDNGILADRIRERLVDTHGVILNDDTMEWYVDTDYDSDNGDEILGNQIDETGERVANRKDGMYTPIGSITALSRRQIENIQHLINRRYEEKYNKGNPIIANTVEIALWKKHRVVIDDASQVWYVEQEEK